MSRDTGLPAALEAVLDDAFIKPVSFLELQLDSGTLYLHDDLGTITAPDADSVSRDWLGVGDLGEIGAIEESDDAQPNGIEVVLSGLSSDLLDEARNQDYQDRIYLIYVSARNTVTGSLVADPYNLSVGRIDRMQIQTGGELDTIRQLLRDETARWQNPIGGYYDDASLQTDYAGDKLLEFLPRMVNLQLDWGKGSPVGFGGVSGRPKGNRSKRKFRQRG